jgi:hypothetical protein
MCPVASRSAAVRAQPVLSSCRARPTCAGSAQAGKATPCVARALQGRFSAYETLEGEAAAIAARAAAAAAPAAHLAWPGPTGAALIAGRMAAARARAAAAAAAAAAAGTGSADARAAAGQAPGGAAAAAAAAGMGSGAGSVGPAPRASVVPNWLRESLLERELREERAGGGGDSPARGLVRQRVREMEARRRERAEAASVSAAAAGEASAAGGAGQSARARAAAMAGPWEERGRDGAGAHAAAAAMAAELEAEEHLAAMLGAVVSRGFPGAGDAGGGRAQRGPPGARGGGGGPGLSFSDMLPGLALAGLMGQGFGRELYGDMSSEGEDSEEVEVEAMGYRGGGGMRGRRRGPRGPFGGAMREHVSAPAAQLAPPGSAARAPPHALVVRSASGSPCSGVPVTSVGGGPCRRQR